MKKIFIVLVLLTNMLIADDVGIDPNELPESVFVFIEQFFPKTKIILAEMDRKKYEIVLENGVEIEFYINGEFKEIEGNYVQVPKDILPEIVFNTIEKTYPNSIITKIKKKWNVYEVKLNNLIYLYIDFNGQLLGQKWDN